MGVYPPAEASWAFKARMQKPRSILVLLLLTVFGVSLAFPAEDLPETVYDESESLPCDMTLRFSGDLVQESARPLQAVLMAPIDLFPASKQALVQAVCRAPAMHPLSDLALILDQTFRC